MKEDGHGEDRLGATVEDCDQAFPADSGVAESRHTRLKKRCASKHSAVEAALDEQDFFATQEGYCRFLQGSYCFYLAFEQWADEAGVGVLLNDWQSRRKAKHLMKDRNALGLTIDAAATEMAIARVTQFSNDRATLMGGLYVTEGATLGAGILAQRAAAIGLTSDNGASFLGAYGRARRRRWKAFLQILETTDMEENRFSDVESAALDVFDAYRQIVIGS